MAFLLLCCTGIASAQEASDKALETAMRFLRENPAQFQLSQEDVSDLRVSDVYQSEHNGLTHVWLQQQYHGIPVYNGLIGLHVDEAGQVYHLGHRLVADLQTKVNTDMPSLSARKALEMVMANLGLQGLETPRLKSKTNEQNMVFEAGQIAKSDIPVSVCYQPLKDGSLRLSWMLVVDQVNTSDVWSIRVDAQNGLILSKVNWTVYCSAGHAHNQGETCTTDGTLPSTTEESVPVLGEAYRVFPLPVESPSHGAHQLVTDPASLSASPYGWHDTNGAAGAEYTYTRGNNVWAYDDSESDNSASVANSVDGGAALNFDFPYDGNAEPTVNRDAAVVNLFYLNNMMHDITHLYGFNEAAGNFQANNYGNGGQAGDAVQAEALDGGGLDNANFATPPDGSSGRMQMYVWGQRGGEVIRVNAPGAILGTYPAAPTSGWGGTITTTPVTGDVVIIDDGTAEGSKGCGPAVNNVAGKIVLVDRGLCEFGTKALNAQQAGAIACIICNFEDGTIGMAAGQDGGQVTIPTMMITKSQCDLFKQFVESGLNMSIVLPTASGPDFVDGDFDNGIIAHEYGHGISNRLTGGPSQAGCLGNPEQMGEGWSDWFSLVTSNPPGSEGTDKRGVGTFVFRQATDGQGIRRYPYSTDMGINPITFATVAENTEVHALGEIWTAVTWDLYWAMVEKYGYDQDWTNTDSGNGRAIQLVMDGMKLQPCGPGFLDGRDAIMMADLINYDGADSCLISEVFARRGMGYFASQGSPDNAGDGIENFDPIPTCVKELKINKSTSTPTINPGEEAHFEIKITNHKDEEATNVIVTDVLPADLDFVSASNGGTFSNGVVSWDLGTLASGEEVTVTYVGKVDDQTGSLRLFRDEMEDDSEWISLFTEGDLEFYLQEFEVYTGDFAWYAEDLAVETDMTLEYINSLIVSGTNPAITFWHKYNTEAAADAGFLEIRRINEQQWVRFDADKVYRNGYPSSVQYGTFAIPFLYGFSGNSNGWVQSYFDLSDYAGEEVTIRFRFGTDDNTGGESWVVDDVEMQDVLFFDEEACVTSGQGDQACARAPERGVIVTPIGSVPTFETLENAFAIRVQPNPATDMLYLNASIDLDGPSTTSLIGMDGRVVLARQAVFIKGGQLLALDVSLVPAGVYTLRVDNAKGSSVVKVVIQ
jgi:uncharacterized repeat protein (TIGR01451 family)